MLALGERVGTPFDETHVLHCQRCRAELSDLERLTEAGRSTTAEHVLEGPDPQVWLRIRAELGFGDNGGR